MRMTRSWHVYSEGDRWRRPSSQARLVLSVDGGHVAVCFNAPVIELLSTADELLHPSLRGLGPDVLVAPLDMSDGLLAVPRVPGLGVELDRAAMERLANNQVRESVFYDDIQGEAPRVGQIL
jgi:endonuclease-8